METEYDRLAAGLRKLEKDLLREQSVASNSEEGRFAYGGFAAATIAKRSFLEQAMALKKSEIDAKHREITAAFGEIKKLEVVIERREQERLAAEAHREQARLDEMGLNIHRRRAPANR